DVVSLTVLAVSNRGDHGDELVILQGFDHLGLNTFDIAHKTDIEQLAGMLGVRQHFFGDTNHATVLTCQTDGLAAGFIDHHDDVLLYLTTQNPLHHFHGFSVGHAHALD